MCRGAAKGRQLEVLHWAHANGCPWDTPLCNAAIRGDEAVVRALIEAKSDLEWTDFVDGERRCTSPLLKATPRLCAY